MNEVISFSSVILRLNALAGLLSVALLAAVLGAAAEAGERRLALIIGNSEYETVADLKNATNDSRAIAAVLARLGFEVTSSQDVGGEAFRRAVDEFSRKADGARTIVFYFSGHGFQLNGANYLVPSDARLTDRDAIDEETLRLDHIITKLQTRGHQTLIFLDACRNNPLPESVRGANAADGLAQVETGRNTFVAFATQPGNVTLDGAGEHSPFTEALLEHLPTRGISISDMMIRVRNRVEERTLHRQMPWDQSSLRSQFYFHPIEAAEGEVVASLDVSAADDPAGQQAQDGKASARLIILPADVDRGKLASRSGAQSGSGQQVIGALSIEPAEEESASAAARPDEAVLWESIAGSTDAADYRRYLDAYPDGSFARIAELNIQALERLSETEKRLKELEVARKAASGEEGTLSLEEVYWGTIRESDLPGDFEAYLRAFPDGSFTDLAQARIESLGRAQEISGAVDPDDSTVTRSQLRAAAMRQYEKLPTQFLQYGLIALGYPLQTVSGVIDSETRLSIRAYQASVSDPQTGRLTAQQTVDLLLAAASVGDEHAQTAVGIMMASGQGLQRDYAFARLWLKLAAEQGNAYAQANLAILHRDGLGGRKDIAAARDLLEKAAAGGLAEATEELKKLKG